MEAEEPAAMAAQAAAAALPPVVKRGPKDPGNKAKREAAAKGKPGDAAPGTRQCPYCKEWLPYWHQEGCPRMPYELWIAATRQRQVAKSGAVVVAGWSVQCQHCGTPFASAASKRVHLSGCERRRNEAELPLNQFPAQR